MMAFFSLKKTFYQTRVSLYVDCEHKNASVIVTHNHVIVATADIAFHEVYDAAKAEAWLSRPCGIHGNFVETMHHDASHGFLAQRVAA